MHTKGDAEQANNYLRHWIYSGSQVKFYCLICISLILMSRCYSTIEFFFSYYAPKGVAINDLSFVKILIKCSAVLAIMPIGSLTFKNIKSDIFLILMNTLFYLLGSIFFITGILGGGKTVFIIGYFFVKVACGLFTSLTLKFMVSYTNCWRYLSLSKSRYEFLGADFQVYFSQQIRWWTSCTTAFWKIWAEKWILISWRSVVSTA